MKCVFVSNFDVSAYQSRRHAYVKELHDEHGSTFYATLPTNQEPVLFTCDPELVSAVLKQRKVRHLLPIMPNYAINHF